MTEGPRRERTTTLNLEKVHSDLTAEQLNQNAKQAVLHTEQHTQTLYDGNQNAQFIFAHLVQIAMPILEAYYSDLYHDAQYLEAADLEKPQTFFYLVGKNGTTWADNYEQAISLSKHGRPHIFRLKYAKHPRLKKAFTLKVKKVAGLYGLTPEGN